MAVAEKRPDGAKRLELKEDSVQFMTIQHRSGCFYLRTEA